MHPPTSSLSLASPPPLLQCSQEEEDGEGRYRSDERGKKEEEAEGAKNS